MSFRKVIVIGGPRDGEIIEVRATDEGQLPTLLLNVPVGERFDTAHEHSADPLFGPPPKLAVYEPVWAWLGSPVEVYRYTRTV